MIKLNADENVAIGADTGNAIKKLITEQLSRYCKHISRLDVHIADENGIKDGFNDIRCMLVSHVDGQEAVVVTNISDTLDQSVDGAIEKMQHALDSMVRGKRKRIEI